MNITEYDKLYDSFEGVVCLFDLSDQILYCNKEFAKLIGFKQQEVVGMSIMDLINPEDRTEFTNNVFVKTQRSSMTIRFYQSSGAHIYLTLNAFRFTNYVMIIGNQIRRNYKGFSFDIVKDEILMMNENLEVDASDITDVVKDHFTSLKIALDNLPLDFWVKDRNHRYVFMNDTMLKKMNFNKGEYFQKTDFELYERDVANDFVTSDLEAIKGHKKTQFTFESKNRKFIKWTEVSKVPLYNKNSEFIGLIGCATDITQIKSRELELIKENEAFIRILQNLYCVVVCVRPNGILENAYGLLNDSLTQHIGEPYQDVFQAKQDIIKHIDDAYKRVESTFEVNLYDKTLEMHVKPIPVDDNLVKILIVGKDVTPR